MTAFVEAPEPPAPPRRTRRVHLAVAGLSALTGAAVVVAVLLLIGWRAIPVNLYQVRVFFSADATTGQKEAARASLDDLFSDEEARLFTREDSLALAKKTYADKGDPLPPTLTAESMSEMAVISIKSREFDCAQVDSLKGGSGITGINVIEFHEEIVIAGMVCGRDQS
ncbi:hypothetical protein FB565_000821 [Actinoplanes lutulentus]|uniref:hypothetical protein n=1 Tax=Actinoplanes lutulentus TaxID=1287878 RepID=UPI000DBA93D1|nr:hypothetical protein [Actinoplanes lutulentus]MBB2941117.1 hypothetical protein [Actinoplanes lutulentus]